MRADYPKIVFVGVPLLLMLWGIVFVLLAFVTRDMVITKYAALGFFILSVPTYGYLATRYAVVLRAVVEDDTISTLQQSNPAGRRSRNLSSRDLWLIGTPVVLMFVAILIAQLMFHATNKEVIQVLKIAVPIMVLVEFIGRRVFGKKK